MGLMFMTRRIFHINFSNFIRAYITLEIIFMICPLTLCPPKIQTYLEETALPTLFPEKTSSLEEDFSIDTGDQGFPFRQKAGACRLQ